MQMKNSKLMAFMCGAQFIGNRKAVLFFLCFAARAFIIEFVTEIYAFILCLFQQIAKLKVSVCQIV